MVLRVLKKSINVELSAPILLKLSGIRRCFIWFLGLSGQWKKEDRNKRQLLASMTNDKSHSSSALQYRKTYYPPQLIYVGKTESCLPQNVGFPGNKDDTFTETHWSKRSVYAALRRQNKRAECERENTPIDQKTIVHFHKLPHACTPASSRFSSDTFILCYHVHMFFCFYFHYILFHLYILITAKPLASIVSILDAAETTPLKIAGFMKLPTYSTRI